MKIKVTAFFQHMPPYSGAAALRGQSIIASLAKLMSGDEGRLTVFCSNLNPTSIQGVTLKNLDVSEVENSLSLKRRLFGEMRLGYVAAKHMFLGAEKPTLAVVSSPGYIAALVQTFFSRLVGVPYVLEMRDIYPQVYAEANLLRRDKLIYRFLQRLSRTMYKRAELVLCATHGLASEVTIEAPTSSVIHIYNGFPTAFAERRGIKYRRFTVCFHGVLGFFQDIETLLKVTERLAQHDVDVVVVGYGRKEALIANCNFPNLRFLGRQSFDNTIQEIERCHIGLCLRLDDGISKDAFPVKVWEYLGLGIPSIVTPPCEAGDFLEKNGCGLVLESGDVEGIVSSVLRARVDNSYLEAMSSNCRRHASHYTREKTGLVAAEAIYKIAKRCWQKSHL